MEGVQGKEKVKRLKINPPPTPDQLPFELSFQKSRYLHVSDGLYFSPDTERFYFYYSSYIYPLPTRLTMAAVHVTAKDPPPSLPIASFRFFDRAKVDVPSSSR